MPNLQPWMEKMCKSVYVEINIYRHKYLLVCLVGWSITWLNVFLIFLHCGVFLCCFFLGNYDHIVSH